MWAKIPTLRAIHSGLHRTTFGIKFKLTDIEHNAQVSRDSTLEIEHNAHRAKDRLAGPKLGIASNGTTVHP